MPSTDRWEVRVSSINMNFTESYKGSIDEVVDAAILDAQVEDAYTVARKTMPEAQPSEVDKAIGHVRFKTQYNKEVVDARQSWDNDFFTVRINIGTYSILIAGFRQDN